MQIDLMYMQPWQLKELQIKNVRKKRGDCIRTPFGRLAPIALRPSREIEEFAEGRSVEIKEMGRKSLKCSEM